MAELLVLRGVPASGKSTFATAMQESHTRVNRDDIRRTMYGVTFGPPISEEAVSDVELEMVRTSLRRGRSVVLDATNLHSKLLRPKLSVAAEFGAEVVYRDFEVSFEEAVKRDAQREKSVGEQVIKKFFRSYKIDPEKGALPRPTLGLPTFERQVLYPGTPTAYIVDTDGTLANHDGVRSPYDTSRYDLDTLHEHVAGVVQSLFLGPHKVIGLSGRDEAFREVTEAWWAKHGLRFEEFHMRPQGDTRMDAIIKYEMYKREIEPRFHVLGAFDDRPQVIRMWRAVGIPVFDVGGGIEF